MKIKVSASFSGVLPSGSYSNMRPAFAADMEYEYEGDESGIKQNIEANQTLLHGICYDKFRSVAELAQIELVKKQKENIRFHPIPDSDGNIIQVPSVSSIASYDKDFSMISPEELQQYASQGTLEDMRCRHFMQTGEWVTDLTKIQGTYTDLAVLKKGALRLESPTQFNFPAFLEKFQIEKLTEGKFTYSLKHKFAGTPDATGVFEGKRFVIDFKRTPDKSYWKQLAGYAIALEEQGAEPFEGLMLIGVNPDTKQGYSKPMITMEVEQCKRFFLDARENFRKLFLV